MTIEAEMTPDPIKPAAVAIDRGTLDAALGFVRALSLLDWIVIALAVVVVIVALALAARWWRRRAAAAPVHRAATRQLIADARGFRRGLPAQARRSFDAFQPIVVLGTESSGKAELIERFSGVAQRRIELGPSAERTGGPLRCVLGGDIVVFEPSEDIVRAPRELVHDDLARALAPILRKRAPIVVVCVSPEVLDKQSELGLADLGRALRTKLDVLCALRGETCRVRVVLSDVPGYARFDALFRLFHLPGIPAILPIAPVAAPTGTASDAEVEEAAVRGMLLAYADDIDTALIQLPPRDTLELIKFFEELPQLASGLAVLLGELFAPAGDLTPRPDGLYLVPDHGGPNPFAVPPGLRASDSGALLKHRLITLSLALAGSFVLLTGYRSDAAAWDRARVAASSYELKADHEIDLRLAIRGYAAEHVHGLVGHLVPRFFLDGPEVVACTYTGRVRRDAVITALQDALARPVDQRRPERALYLAALLYADRHNQLGDLIRDRLDDWAAAVGLAASQLTDYLALADPYLDDHWIERLRDAGQAQPHDDLDARLARFLELLAPDHVWTAPDLAEVRQLAAALVPAVHELAPFGAAQRILSLPPLDRLAAPFKVQAARFSLLAQLWDDRVVLDGLVTGASELGRAVPPGAPPHTFAALATTLAPLVGDGRAAKPQALAIAGRSYTVTLAGLAGAVRGAEIDRIVAEFGDHAAGDADAGDPALWIDPARATQLALAIAWPAGTSGAVSHARLYTREVFEAEVKPAALAVHRVVAPLDARPATRDRLAQLLGAALERYASDYDAELARVVTSFHVDIASEAAGQRVLRALAGAGSPLRAMITAVAHDAQLGLAGDSSGVFDAMAVVEDHFGQVAAVVAAGKGGDALVGYQDALRALAARLGAPPGDKPAAAAAAPSPAAAIVARLSPAGALAFAQVQGTPDPAVAALDAWLADKPFPDDVAEVFRAPGRAIAALGARDVTAALAAWARDIAAAADADVFSRFPFDRRSGDDADPQSLIDWLQPKRGRFAAALVPAVAGLVLQVRGWNGQPHFEAAHPCSDAGCVRVPASLLATFDRLAAMADLLWDDAGKPRPLEVAVTPRPFALVGRGPVPELIRLAVGDATVFYFNQRPRRSALAIDWSHDHTASLSVQLAQDGTLSLTPPAVVAAGSPWSFFHLLEQAEHHGATYTWRIALAAGQVLAVSVDVNEAGVRAPHVERGDALVSHAERGGAP